jgi:NADH:ubiquinone reductase (H+-translocating)
MFAPQDLESLAQVTREAHAPPGPHRGREARGLARPAPRRRRRIAPRIHAALTGGRARPFHFDALGALCVVGHHTACAELRVPFTRRHMRFSGLLAWMMWGAIDVAKLPGLERKVRVLSDWTLELFFPRDIVRTIDLSEPGPRPASEVTHA